jgi:tetratricopeptide (TPR) repeat protein
MRLAPRGTQANRVAAAADELRNSEASRLAHSLFSIEELRSLSPRDFENVIARLFKRLGYQVEQTPFVNDGGRDLILTKDGQKFLAECKRYKDGNTSGRPDLQKFYAAILADAAVSGFFVTAGGFSKEAKAYARTVPITLVDQHDLKRMMFQSSPEATDDYSSMCLQCSETVHHQLRKPQTIKCPNGHQVAPTLNIELVVAMSASARRGTTEYEKIERRKRKAIKALSDLSEAAAEKSPQPVGPSDQLAETPEAAIPYYSRACSYANKGRHDLALAEFDRAIALAPKKPVYFIDRGTVYLNRRDYDRAISDLDEAVRLDRTNARAFWKRGQAYACKLDLDRAIADYDEAIKLDPKFADAFFRRGIAFAALQNHERALLDYDEAIRLDPQSSQAFSMRGSSYRLKGDYDSAIADCNQAIVLDAKNELAFFSRGAIYEEKGQCAWALADYDEAIRLHPNFELAIDRRARLRLREEDNAE